MLRYHFIVIVLFVIAMGPRINLQKGNPKKKRHNRKPPVRGKQLELSRRRTHSQVIDEGASVGSCSKIVVEDASIGDLSDGDDSDSCFGACLASNKDYDGPVDCILEGSGDVPVVDCTFLQREQTQSSGRNSDAMECKSEASDGMDDDVDELRDVGQQSGDDDSSNGKESVEDNYEHIWWRFEFQDSVGNLPHIHALIWL